MSTEQTTTAVAKAAKPQTVDQWLTAPAFKDQIARALPQHMDADRMLRVATTCVSKAPGLRQCDPMSFVAAMLSLSQFGLEPDGRHAHLIPYGKTVQLVVDYKGLVALARRSGDVTTIKADKVCENDVFTVDLGQITEHKIDYRKPRGKAYAYYCMVQLKDGATQHEVMTVEEVDAIRKRSKAGGSGPWVTDYDEMAKKTVFKRLSKWLTLSPEFRDAFEKDDDTVVDRGGMKVVTPVFDASPSPFDEEAEAKAALAEAVAREEGGAK